MGAALGLLDGIWYELALFAGAGLLIGGIDDLAIDLIWLVRGGWRRRRYHRGRDRVCVATLKPPRAPGRIAVLIGAWHEEGIVGAMLATASRRWAGADVRIYVGLYPNDPGTAAEVHDAAAADDRIRPVPGILPGPTTKAEALNRAWAAMIADERCEGRQVKAVVLHDAEDMVHGDELALFDRLIERCDVVQLPVLPLIEPGRTWIGGHYADEFAEAHGKQLVVREWLGAGIPLAGTGCAIARGAIARVAAENGGLPFADDSLTEDYELGLRIRAFGGRCAFVRMLDRTGGQLVAVRAHFPHVLEASVRQKTRWLRGIAFEGWDRLGWSDSPVENWMRLRDRRAPFSALVLSAAYLVLALGVSSGAVRLAAGLPLASPVPATPLFIATLAMLGWRLAMRCLVVTRVYGWRQGLLAMPRLVVGNVVAMAAAWRALVCYALPHRAPATRWDKTVHSFPHAIAAE